MSKDLTVGVGFACRPPQAPACKPPARLELIASVTLAVSTVIAATAVSIGIARADAPGAAGGDGPFAIALFLALVLAGMGGVTAAILGSRARR